MESETVRVLICCPDQPGIIAAVAGFFAEEGGNILEADQHSDPATGEFLMRVEVSLDGFRLDRGSFERHWSRVSDRFSMQWRVYWGGEPKRMAILAGKEDHCLSDLLWRWKTGELTAAIPFVASNHPDVSDQVEACGIDFHHVPVSGDDCAAQEAKLLSLMEQANVEVIVLARYMQILTPAFVRRYTDRIINIHHSFLPAFAGPRPYHQAYERGVKIIGATSHYVTDQLDGGPIIAQATMPVGHRNTVKDIIRKGRDLERVVLASAVRLHLEDKILVSRGRTVIFD